MAAARAAGEGPEARRLAAVTSFMEAAAELFMLLTSGETSDSTIRGGKRRCSISCSDKTYIWLGVWGFREFGKAADERELRSSY